MKKIELTNGGFAMVDDEDCRWLTRWNWQRNAWGYAYRCQNLDGKRMNILMARAIVGAGFGIQVDHINRDRLDNRKDNLRLATRQQNAFNTTKRSNNSSGFKGVTFSKHKRKFVAEIRHDGKHVHIGTFLDPKEAYKAYCSKAVELRGGFGVITDDLIIAVLPQNP